MFNVINKGRISYLYNDFVVQMLKDKNRKPFFQQVKEILFLSLEIKYWPHNYFKYGGYKKNITIDEIKLYMTGLIFSDFRREFLNDIRYAAFADDKFLFHKCMSGANIPTAKFINVISYNHLTKQATGIDGENALTVLDSISSDAIVIKPAIDSQQGAGVYVVNVTCGENKKFEISGVLYNSMELIDKIFMNSKCVYLIEEKIKQHPFNMKLHPHSVNTVRIDTLLTKNGEIIINSAYLRIGRNGRNVDNWSGKLGGIGVNINIINGELSECGVDYSRNVYLSHPDTHIDFFGLTIPYWNDIVDLVKKAALELPKLRSLGWDVALTENGPILLEVNRDYDILAQQTCTQAFGKNKAFYNELINYADTTKYCKNFVL
ncbi:sugar-transfer associated ATP-grasp domain-containing protein [Vibrio misgurnus]|uniref:sugar-transfer associated ATP-grasp domain-containing protein n=1 Tax=Vibrio misgurnus TaxID=2993714 RepID=UPI002415CB3C|nr:sugar-transfer associated ATP-grasp domain-containing protein [Vibrio sp. gvc]